MLYNSKEIDSHISFGLVLEGNQQLCSSLCMLFFLLPYQVLMLTRLKLYLFCDRSGSNDCLCSERDLWVEVQMHCLLSANVLQSKPNVVQERMLCFCEVCVCVCGCVWLSCSCRTPSRFERNADSVSEMFTLFILALYLAGSSWVTWRMNPQLDVFEYVCVCKWFFTVSVWGEVQWARGSDFGIDWWMIEKLIT